MNLEDILKGIEIKESREETKQLMRRFKSEGMTKDELKALYTGIGTVDINYKCLVPLMLLWIDEIWNKENTNEST